LEIGRTSAYRLIKTPGFPTPLKSAQRGYQWDAEAVNAFLASPNPSEPGSASEADAAGKYVIDTPEGITVYPPLRAGDGWRAQWYDPDGRRRACRATSEANMATKLEPIKARLTAANAGTPPSTTITTGYTQQHSPASPRTTPGAQTGSTPARNQPRTAHRAAKAAPYLPGHEEVAALAAALARKRLCPWWFELLPYMSAYSGLHMGEIFALDLQHIGLGPTERTISVEWKIIETHGQTIRVPTEGCKRRLTVYPQSTPTGYDLEAMIARRVEEASADKAVGRNRLGLMFPAPRGGYLRKSNFINRHAVPAYTTAGCRTDPDGLDLWSWYDLRRLFWHTALNTWGLNIPDASALSGDSAAEIGPEHPGHRGHLDGG
jgi:integrase